MSRAPLRHDRTDGQRVGSILLLAIVKMFQQVFEEFTAEWRYDPPTRCIARSPDAVVLDKPEARQLNTKRQDPALWNREFWGHQLDAGPAGGFRSPARRRLTIDNS